MASSVSDLSDAGTHLRRRPVLAARLRRLARGRPEDPSWVRPALLAIVAVTLLLLVWALGRAGYANGYYSAAVLAGTKSWKAFFFGSLDAGNYITVDKPPMALWLMEISARLFGFNSWSMLLPEALAGVAAVLLLYATVRRVAGARAALAAAALLALTPVAVAIFRYNNPDALLTLLMVAAAYALVRSLETGRTRWLLLSAALVGMAFTTKMLQAYMVLPALAVTYLVAARGSLLRRLGRLLAAGGVLLVSSGWWLVIVDLIPASSRPWIGGSTHNSVLDLVLNYNGLGRLTGQEGGFGGGPSSGSGFGGGPGGGFGFGGATGLLRIVNDELGGQIAWLIPLALVGLAAGLWARRRAPRTDLVRAGYLLFGLWLITHALVFDYAGGILHGYYTVAMAPAVAALAALGTLELWRMRSHSWIAGLVLGATVAGTAVLADVLLSRTPTFVPWLRTAVLVAGVAAGVALAVPAALRRPGPRSAVIAVAALALMAGPVSYSVDTVVASAAGAAGGALVAAGPSSGSAGGFGGLPGGRGGPGGRVFTPPAGLGSGPAADFGLPSGTGPGSAELPAFAPGGSAGGLTLPAGFGGPAAMDGGAADGTLLQYLEKHRGSATWIVATWSVREASSLELSSGTPVMAMGGFSGSDPAMTVDRLRSLVASGKLRYVLAGGAGGPAGDGSSGSVMAWVQSHGKAVDYGGGSSGATLYDLAGAASS